MSTDKLDSVKAWEDFCEQLKAAGAVLARPSTPRDDLSQAEGLRKLVRMIRMGFEASLEYADTHHPEVYRLVTPTTLGEGETSDARYYQTMIDGSKTYILSGDRGDAPFMEFTVYAGKIGLDAHSAQVGALTELDLKVDAEGRYELILSPEEHAGNWIRTTPEANVVFIRQYAHDWCRTVGATFDIRQTGAETKPSNVTLAQVMQALPRTAAYVARSTAIWAGIVDQARQAPVNRFATFSDQASEESPEMPTGHRFSSGHFRLEPDEGLLVSFMPAQVPYWGVDITNYWFEPMSYPSHRSHINNRTAAFESDGSVQVMISAGNPGTGNWIDTRGHRDGMMMLRWSRTALPVPAIETRVVRLKS
jgi:hypothetical protein